MIMLYLIKKLLLIRSRQVTSEFLYHIIDEKRWIFGKNTFLDKNTDILLVGYEQL